MTTRLILHGSDVGNVTQQTTIRALMNLESGLTAGLLRCAPIAAPRFLGPVFSRITNRLAESFINEMAATARVDRAAVDWWDALQHARCLPNSPTDASIPHRSSAPASQKG